MFGYKATELREIEDTDFHTSYEKIIEVWGWKNKNKKGKGKLVGKSNQRYLRKSFPGTFESKI